VLSPAVAADALRIIQEGLTNSMKHAPGAPVSVTLEVTATGLNIDIINEPARSAPLELDGGAGGAGLTGMTERVKAHGGQLSAGPVPGGGWRVAASLLWCKMPFRSYSGSRVLATAAQAVEREGPADGRE
jgi:signal transduction histidine kinase